MKPIRLVTGGSFYVARDGEVIFTDDAPKAPRARQLERRAANVGPVERIELHPVVEVEASPVVAPISHGCRIGARYPAPSIAKVSAPAAIAPVERIRVRARRLPRVAYAEARATRQGIDADMLDAYDLIWRSLYPLGRATLAERFAEWCDAHPGELADHRLAYAEKRERALIREVDREYERAERAAMCDAAE